MWTYMGHPLDPAALPTKEALIASLQEKGADDRAMADLRDEHWQRLDRDLTWRYPLGQGEGAGGFITPVQEGMLWIPYQVIDQNDGELLELQDACLLAEHDCVAMANELATYSAELFNVLDEAARISHSLNSNASFEESPTVSQHQHKHVRIYAIIEDWALDDEPGHNEELFTSHEDALLCFREKLSEEKANGCIPQWVDNETFTVDEADEFYEAWLDGEYVCNHYLLKIEPKLIQCDPAFGHLLGATLRKEKQ